MSKHKPSTIGGSFLTSIGTNYLYAMGANYLEGTIKTIWIGPMAQSEDINQSEDFQVKL